MTSHAPNDRFRRASAMLQASRGKRATMSSPSGSLTDVGTSWVSSQDRQPLRRSDSTSARVGPKVTRRRKCWASAERPRGKIVAVRSAAAAAGRDASLTRTASDARGAGLSRFAPPVPSRATPRATRWPPPLKPSGRGADVEADGLRPAGGRGMEDIGGDEHGGRVHGDGTGTGARHPVRPRDGRAGSAGCAARRCTCASRAPPGSLRAGWARWR